MTTVEYVDHVEVMRRLREHLQAKGESSLWVGQGSTATDYGQAELLGLITREQVNLARERAGNLWNYAGD